MNTVIVNEGHFEHQYLNTIESKMHRQKAAVCLATYVRHNRDRYITRSDLVLEKVAAKATIKNINGYGRCLQTPDGCFMDERAITKTAMDFAAFLIANGY